MLQIYIMYVKMMLHRKRFYIWYLFVPIVFACLLFLVTRSLTDVERFTVIPVGIVNETNQQEYDAFVRLMSDVQEVKGQEIFELRECSEEEATSLLFQDEIDAYIVVGENLRLYVKQNGLSQSIVKSFVDQYEQFLQMCRDSQTELSTEAMKQITMIEMDTVGDIVETDNSILYFYTLIGLCCFLTFTFGFHLSDTILSNQSRLAARMNCTPAGIFQRFFSGLLAAMTVALFGLILIMCFIRYILGFPFVFEMNFVWLLSIVGMLVGILFGYVLGSLFRAHKAWKETIAMTMILLFSFFAGIVRIDVKYYIEQNGNWLGYVNPVGLVSDGLYSLLNQGDFFSYLLDLAVLGIFGILLFVVALVQTGRRTYDRI